MFTLQKDMRSEPVKRVVALGESTTWGYSVSSKEKCWVNQVVAALEEFRGSEIELINQGISSNVLTPECPAYESSAKPSALERLDSDVIALNLTCFSCPTVSMTQGAALRRKSFVKRIRS